MTPTVRLPLLLLTLAILCPVFVLSLDLKDFLKLLSNTKCSNITYEKDLNLKEFEGIWYISYQINPMLAADPPCQNFEIKTSLDKLDISMNSRIFPGMVMKAKAKGKINDPAKPAIMTWTWNFLPNQPEKTMVVETDYKNYAVLVTCNPYGLGTAGFLLSRETHIPENYLNTGTDVLGQYFNTSLGRPMQTLYCNLDPIAPNEKIIQLGQTGMEELFKKVFSK